MLPKSNFHLKIANFKVTTQTKNNPVKMNDQNFVSISEAARFFQMSLSTVRLRLNDPNYDNWNSINNEKRLITTLARPVVVNDTYYLRVSLTAAKIGISERTVRKNIKIKSNQNFFDQLSENQKKKIQNLNQQINDSKKATYTLGRPVQVGTEIFPSIRKTALASSIDSHTIRKRIHSNHFPDWKWFS